MKVNPDKPWVESTTKKPRVGEVIKVILEGEKKRLIERDSVNSELTDIETQVTNELNKANEDVTTAINEHIKATGAVHGETKDSIKLGLKENLPAATLDEIDNQKYERKYLTPKVLNQMLSNELEINSELYVKSGSLPLSYGVTLGRALFNQRFVGTKDPTLGTVIPKNISNFLLSTEESYLLFGDHGEGLTTSFSTGGIQAPVGPLIIDIRNDNISTTRSIPCSLNDITVSDALVSEMTGLGFGFGVYNGNYYDSNFHATVQTTATASKSVKQSSDAALFDKTIVYKPEGSIVIRNYNLTKHNFNELFFPGTEEYALNAATFLSADDVLMYTANCEIVKYNGIYGIVFDIVSGNIGTSDWYPSSITKKTNKILSKKATLNVHKTVISSIDGYAGASSIVRSSATTKPYGPGYDRENFSYSNFASTHNFSSLFVPINILINGFDALSNEDKLKLLGRVDTELLKRITLAWTNKFSYEGVLRLPFFIEGSKGLDEYSFNMWLDFSFKLTNGSDTDTFTFSSINYDKTITPKLDANLDLTGNLGKFEKIIGGIKDNPLHPKVLGGCFVETGGHIQTYVVGYRQYICYYKHQVGSALSWIKDNLTPVIESIKVTDCGTYPTNGGYGENTRFVPIGFTSTTVEYLAYIRNKKGKYQYAAVSYPISFDIKNDMFSNPTSLTWLERLGEKDLPLLVVKTDYNKVGLEINGMVFTEGNNFTGSYNPNWVINHFEPTETVTIKANLKQKAIVKSKIKNPYAIFFYYNSVLYWVISDTKGIKNLDGYDTCFGAVRVDVYEAGEGKYEIRQLETMEETYRFGNMFTDVLPESFYGRTHESFDDVFITTNPNSSDTLDVFVNYPTMIGRYVTYQIKMDGLGYYYPTEFAGKQLDITLLNGYGVTTPHSFYPSSMVPVITSSSISTFNDELYSITHYDKDGISNFNKYFMGWKDELPLYVVGSNFAVNGKSILLDKTVKLTDLENHSGKVFITYDGDKEAVYSSSNNPNLYSTDPSIENVFVGFWSKVGDYHTISYHPIRGVNDVVNDDFVNALLPVITNAQMGTYKMGSTFPLYLGKIKSKPRQYYFKS